MLQCLFIHGFNPQSTTNNQLLLLLFFFSAWFLFHDPSIYRCAAKISARVSFRPLFSSGSAWFVFIPINISISKHTLPSTAISLPRITVGCEAVFRGKKKGRFLYCSGSGCIVICIQSLPRHYKSRRENNLPLFSLSNSRSVLEYSMRMFVQLANKAFGYFSISKNGHNEKNSLWSIKIELINISEGCRIL